MPAKTLPFVLLRHGESQWNLENRFTGWTDVDLTEKGRDEARAAGRLMKAEGFEFDHTHTSLLKRAIRTHALALEEMDRMWLPVSRTWRLNERHYGALQGLDKAETAAKYGEAQVKIWRRSFDTPPPALEAGDPRAPGHDPRYRELRPEERPLTESLKDTIARFRPYWEDTLIPQLREGKRLLVVAHGNSLRALVKILDGVSDSDIIELNIPTGIPLLYELDRPASGGVKALGHRYLGDAETAARAAQAVANQSKSK